MKPRVLTIQDISCFGKCSLTVALPVLSSCGIETVILPTALLSTHTAGFTDYTYLDLTEQVPLITKHWQDNKIEFQAIYTGYIGKAHLVEDISNYLLTFKSNKTATENTTIIVDPVFGDNGVIYPGMDKKYVSKVRELCKLADIIVPNITEACYLAEQAYLDYPYQKEDILKLAQLLANKLQVEHVIITGIKIMPEYIGIIHYQKANNIMTEVYNEEIKTSYHGTGDLFASTFVGCILNKFTIEQAMKLAGEFTKECIKQTYNEIGPCYGVLFEENLPKLWQLMNEMKKDR